MTDSSKKVSEEELEKQYEDYRAQFEQWKENNKSSIGTDAYNSYVKQFEQWEKEVEARKHQQKTQNHQAASDAKDAEAAAAYAQSQEAYMAHHLKAMKQAEMQQRAVAAAAVQQQQLMQSFSRRPPVIRCPSKQIARTCSFAKSPPECRLHPRDQNFSCTGNAQVVGSPPALWGNSKVAYDSKDPLFAKWGSRAATVHTKPSTEHIINPVACWMLLDTLREKKMVLAPHSNNFPPPSVPNQTK